MERIAGMTITDGTVALVVLAREGEGWRIDRVAGPPPLAFTVESLPPPDCPVIVDATAWVRKIDPGMPYAPPWSPVDTLRAAGWRVHPPLWEGGRAVNPKDHELFGNCAAFVAAHVRGETRMETTELATAFRLASWGATHETTAGPMPALRSEDDPPRAKDDALAYVPTVHMSGPDHTELIVEARRRSHGYKPTGTDPASWTTAALLGALADALEEEDRG